MSQYILMSTGDGDQWHYAGFEGSELDVWLKDFISRL